MGTPKIGLSYYWIQTDRYQDPKIKRLKRKYKAAGLGVYDFVLSELYRQKGCFLDWDDDACFDVAEYFEMEESLVDDIVKYCISIGLFSQKKFEEKGKLTSLSIQNRFKEISRRAKRTAIIPEEIAICPEESNSIREEEAILPEKNASIPQDRIGKDKIGKDKIVRAKALVASDEADSVGKETQEKYKLLTHDLTGHETKMIWIAVKKFIAELKPQFIQPYVDMWNLFAQAMRLAKIEQITDSRKKKFNARIRDPGFDFLRVLEGIKTSPMLKGESGNGWRVTFDWIIENDKNYLKIIEGQYS